MTTQEKGERNARLAWHDAMKAAAEPWHTRGQKAAWLERAGEWRRRLAYWKGMN